MKHGVRVEAEAAALAAVRHAGVVELVGVTGDTLRTREVGGARSLAEAGPFTADEIAGVLASVASTLADLHAAGVVHGGIDASHVLLHPEGRTVLCSLGRGGDPAGDVAALGRLVGDLLVDVRPANEGPPRPEGGRKWRRSPGPVPVLFTPPVAPVLTELAAAAMAGELSARDLATAVHQRVATARVPLPPGREPLFARRRPPASNQRSLGRRAGERTGDSGHVHRRLPVMNGPENERAGGESDAGERSGDSGHVHRRLPVMDMSENERAGGEGAAGRRTGDSEPVHRRIPVMNGPENERAGGDLRDRVMAAGHRRTAGSRRRPFALGAGVLLAVPVVLLATNALASSSRPVAAPPATEPATTTTTETPATAATTTPTSTPPPAAVRVWPADPLDYDAGVLTVDGVRYAVGQPGDALVAGDWACTGRRTVALLRPPTGEVFAFDAWAEDDEVPARLVGTVEGAAGLRAVPGDDGCDDLEVVRPEAEPVVLDAAPEQAG